MECAKSDVEIRSDERALMSEKSKVVSLFPHPSDRQPLVAQTTCVSHSALRSTGVPHETSSQLQHLPSENRQPVGSLGLPNIKSFNNPLNLLPQQSLALTRNPNFFKSVESLPSFGTLAVSGGVDVANTYTADDKGAMMRHYDVHTSPSALGRSPSSTHGNLLTHPTKESVIQFGTEVVSSTWRCNATAPQSDAIVTKQKKIVAKGDESFGQFPAALNTNINQSTQFEKGNDHRYPKISTKVSNPSCSIPTELQNRETSESKKVQSKYFLISDVIDVQKTSKSPTVQFFFRGTLEKKMDESIEEECTSDLSDVSLSEHLFKHDGILDGPSSDENSDAEFLPKKIKLAGKGNREVTVKLKKPKAPKIGENTDLGETLSSKKSPRQKHPVAESFYNSTAKATVTTTVVDNATIVTLSIPKTCFSKNTITSTTSTLMSRGTLTIAHIKEGQVTPYDVSALQDSLLGKVSSNKETGESESKSNGTDGSDNDGDNKDTDKLKQKNCNRTSSMPTTPQLIPLSIMSKIKQKNEKKSPDANQNETLEISIRIEDSQLVTHGDQKRWQCHMCVKSYTTKHNLVTHILDHSGIKPHCCMVCGKYFKQLSHLNTHMLTHDNIKPHICKTCNKGFTQISHLKRHHAVHMTSKPYVCDMCSRGFAYPSELRVHKEKHVPGRDKCVDCGEDFPSQKMLKQHQLTHEQREELTCKHCQKMFRYPSQLRDHLVSHSGSRPYICQECGVDFMKEHHLKAHQFTHTGMKPYKCEDCQRSFNQKANLIRHMLIHNADRAYRCDMCGKTFTQPQTLKAHMVVHADTKPFQCKLCGKQFGRLHNLHGHIHMHNNTKPYICFCGSSFTLKGNLNRHKKVKHGLSESTESLEEEAVNFLSSLSERAREERGLQDDEEQTLLTEAFVNYQDDTEDSGPRKHRKSTPRRIIPRLAKKAAGMVKKELESEGKSEDEAEVMARYFPKLKKQKNAASTKKVKGKRKASKSVEVKREMDENDSSNGSDEDTDDYYENSDKDDGAKNDASDMDWTPGRKSRQKPASGAPKADPKET